MTGNATELPHEKQNLFTDIRLLFATILTDPGSSLAYGADALIAVTIVAIKADTQSGFFLTIAGGAIVMFVYLIAIIIYNSMTHHHTHPILGGGAYVSALITSSQIRKHPRFKQLMKLLGKTGTASLLADFPATQAISIISGVEALYSVIKYEDRLKWAIVFIVGLSIVQRYGLGNLSRYMIWPVLLFYAANLGLNAWGVGSILANGWTDPVIGDDVDSSGLSMAALLLMGVANGSTLITGVEVGYSSVNIPFHKGRAVRTSMWALYVIVLLTYSMQLVNFLGLGVLYSPHIPVPIQIAKHLGGDDVATVFGIITVIMLLLAAQTAQPDFPLEMLRGARSNFFPRGIGDTAWKRTKPAPVIGGHEGLYNPRATLILGALSIFILYFFPTSHHIEGMYGLAVVTAMNIAIASYFVRQIRARKISLITLLGMIIMVGMFVNILYNKFFEGAWFILLLMIGYMIIFVVSESIYNIWNEKLNVVPMEFGLWYPAFQNLKVDKNNIVLVSKFHPGVVHFLKNYIKSGHIPYVVHFQTDPEDRVPEELPDWFVNIEVPPGMDTITAITNYIREHRPMRTHLIPMLVKGIDPISRYYFGNSMERLKHAISQYCDLQVEYNRERVEIQTRDLIEAIFPFGRRFFKDTPPASLPEKATENPEDHKPSRKNKK